MKLKTISRTGYKQLGGRTTVNAWTPKGSMCEDTHEDTPEDQLHVWPQVWCYHIWGHTCAHRCGLLLLCVLMCGIFTHMRPHVRIVPHLWPYMWSQVWFNHMFGLNTCVATHAVTNVDCSSRVSSFVDFYSYPLTNPVPKT